MQAMAPNVTNLNEINRGVALPGAHPMLCNSDPSYRRRQTPSISDESVVYFGRSRKQGIDGRRQGPRSSTSADLLRTKPAWNVDLAQFAEPPARNRSLKRRSEVEPLMISDLMPACMGRASRKPE